MPRAARVVHHIHGRIRVKLPSARGDHPTLERIKQSISPLPGVREVQINSSTGGILVHYDANHYDDFHRRLTEHGESEGLFALEPPALSQVDEIARVIEREAEFLASRSETARTLVDMFRQANIAVKRATRNAVDLNVLLPLGLAAYSLLELEAEMSTPLWLTLGIFSFNSFVMLHTEPLVPPVSTTRELITENSRALPSPEPPASRRARKRPKP